MLGSQTVAKTGKPGRPRKWTDEEREELINTSIRFTPEQNARAKALASFEVKTLNDLIVELIDRAIAAHGDRDAIVLLAKKNLSADLAKRTGGDERVDDETPEASEVSVLLASGSSELEKKRYVHALGHFRRAAGLSPGNAECHYWAGVALVQMNLKGDQSERTSRDLQKQAIAAFEKALELDPSHREAERALRLARHPLPTSPKPSKPKTR